MDHTPSEVSGLTTVRPTKKQRDILMYIEAFIAEHGYSPSYREIMNGLDYTSVATVSLHVNSLIRRGHLHKRDRSARSLEVVTPSPPGVPTATSDSPPDKDTEAESWLVSKVEAKLISSEQAGELAGDTFDEIAVLINALRVLGLQAAAAACMPRLAALHDKHSSSV